MSIRDLNYPCEWFLDVAGMLATWPLWAVVPGGIDMWCAAAGHLWADAAAYLTGNPA